MGINIPWNFLTSLAGVATLLLMLTASGINLLKPNVRDSIALWLMGAQDERSWSHTFCTIFDVIFSEKHFSFRCFILSSFCSIATVLLLWILFDSFLSLNIRTENAMPIWQILILGASINILPDYLSLWETRWLLQKFPAERSWIWQVCVLILDAIITGAIIFYSIQSYRWLMGESPISIGRMLFVYDSYGLFFWSTFFTSIWAWLYAFSTWVMRISSGILIRIADIENQPGTILGLFIWAATFSIGIGSYTVLRDDNARIERFACANFPITCNDGLRLRGETKYALEFIQSICGISPEGYCIEAQFKKLNWTPKRAAEILQKSCYDRENESQGNQCQILGYMYSQGIGVRKNEKTSFDLYNLSCKKDHFPSCTSVAIAYETGSGVKQNIKKALMIFKNSCYNNEPYACTRIGRIYKYGLMDFPDIDLAHKFYNLGCSDKNIIGCQELAQFYDDKSNRYYNPKKSFQVHEFGCERNNTSSCLSLAYSYMNGIGVDANTTLAFKIFETECQKQNPLACLPLGREYLYGKHLPKNEKKAFNIFVKMCENIKEYYGGWFDLGSDEGCFELANIYHAGIGVPANPKMALYFYSKACNFGHMFSCVVKGNIYKNGNIVTKNIALSMLLYQRACEGREAIGCNNLGYEYQYGEEKYRNHIKALNLYTKACDGNLGVACFNLGYTYQNSIEVKINLKKAVKMYLKSCDLNYNTACKELKKLKLGPRAENGR